MIRRFFDHLAARRSGGLHPDLTFEDVEAAPPESPASRPAHQRAPQEANAVHPDFDFDPDFAGLPNDVTYLQSNPPATIQQTGQHSALLPPVLPEEDTPYLDSSHAEDDHDRIFEPASDPLDLAISLDDLAVEEDDVPPDVDWDDYSVEAINGVTVQEIEPLDIFDFDISDLEAEFEAEPVVPETPSARDQRLDGVAADLVLGLGAFPSSERRALHRRFRAVLEEFPHQSSHLALHRLLRAGASLEEIEEAASLRRLWLDQPWLWGQKRRILRAWEVWRNPGQRLAFGWPTALRLVRVFGKWATLLTLLFTIPLFVSENIRLYGWVLFLIKNGVLLGTLKSVFGLQMESMLFSLPAIILGMVYVYLPFMLFPMTLGISMVPNETRDAAFDLGASRWQVFREVELPLSMPGIVIGFLLTFVLAIGAIAEAKVLGGQRVIPITHDIEIAFTYSQNWPLGAALSVLLMLVVGALVLLALRRFDLDSFLGRR